MGTNDHLHTEPTGYVPEKKMGVALRECCGTASWERCRCEARSPHDPSAAGASEQTAGGEKSDRDVVPFDPCPIPGTLVIGLGHKARHGKDTAADILVDTYEGVKRYAFADDLYAYCRIMHGMAEKDAPLLQRVGVEMRQRDENVWVRAVYNKILADKPRVAVISDVRFPNEMDFVRKLGGVCWKVERKVPVIDDAAPRGEYRPFVDPSRPADHVSEIALDDAKWDTTLVNTSLQTFTGVVRGTFERDFVIRVKPRSR